METMATPDEEINLGQSKDETPLAPAPASTSPAIFTPFPLLPSELQLLIWDHCVSNAFVTYQRLKQSSSRALISPTTTPSSFPPEPKYVNHRRLCKRRWMRLILACRNSYQVAVKADADFKRREPKRYWIFGRKWEEMVMFLREGAVPPFKSQRVGEFDEDADVRW